MPRQKKPDYLNRLKDDANAAGGSFGPHSKMMRHILRAAYTQNYYVSRGLMLRLTISNLHTELPNTPYAQKGIVPERIFDLENTKIPFVSRASKNPLIYSQYDQHS